MRFNHSSPRCFARAQVQLSLRHMYWRNILDVAREEQLQAVRANPMTLPLPRLDVVAPSIDGLEVVELTVLEVYL
jgi:hypothetical protein